MAAPSSCIPVPRPRHALPQHAEAAGLTPDSGEWASPPTPVLQKAVVLAPSQGLLGRWPTCRCSGRPCGWAKTAWWGERNSGSASVWWCGAWLQGLRPGPLSGFQQDLGPRDLRYGPRSPSSNGRESANTTPCSVPLLVPQAVWPQDEQALVPRDLVRNAQSQVPIQTCPARNCRSARPSGTQRCCWQGPRQSCRKQCLPLLSTRPSPTLPGGPTSGTGRENRGIPGDCPSQLILPAGGRLPQQPATLARGEASGQTCLAQAWLPLRPPGPQARPGCG